MNLRNKKTGRLANIIGEQDFIRVYTDAGFADYYSLAELNEEWEDYVPKEPLIKDEKVRKAIRTWAEANGVGRVMYMENIYRFSAIGISTSLVVDFGSTLENSNLEGGFYNIDELCGEEKE